MAITVLLAPVKAGLGALLSPTERWALEGGRGAQDGKLRADVEFHTSRPWD